MPSNPRSKAEEQRLQEADQRTIYWRHWGPYLSERQWGTVREDYSPNGTAWEYFPHDHARSRAYRWGEDGIGGICDRHQRICFAPTLWNRRDPILKERLFGLTGNEGNHGEDVKELYFYLDATPTSSYLKMLYKYPQAAFPYAWLHDENARRGKQDPEFELLDTGIFDANRYFDVFVEYAKVTAEDILIRITATNAGPESAPLDLLPTVWFRNTWTWGRRAGRPKLWRESIPEGSSRGRTVIGLEHKDIGRRWLVAEGTPQLLFAENETNFERVFGFKGAAPYPKDAFHDYLIAGRKEAVNPAETGTKAAALYPLEIPAGASAIVRLRLINGDPNSIGPASFGEEFENTFTTRIAEADEFFARRQPPRCPPEHARVQRQAFAGLLWNRQSYHYDVSAWLDGDPTQPAPPPQRKHGRNHNWRHLYNADVLLMPDKWEFPWYASWDMAFHCVATSLIDPWFAKEQLILLLRDWYMHPNGQLPAYEWSFDDVNPPVHAWAALRVYKIERRIYGRSDRAFLERIFHKLLLNFTWWVNRQDPEGLNVFQGGFLGLDNVGLFDRSAPLPTGGHLEQSDGTAWMGMYCLNMLAIALELSRDEPAYEDVASKFFEHFVYITQAMNDHGGDGQSIALWDAEDGFYYDALRMPNGDQRFLKVRSAVGLIPLFAVLTLEPERIASLAGFKKRMQWSLDWIPSVAQHVDSSQRSALGPRILLSLVSHKHLFRVLRYMLDSNEFLSPYGIRSLSKVHRDHPYTFQADGGYYRVDYEPAESRTGTFGGNSNWRGPVWFPLNFLIIEALQGFHYYFGDGLQVECPTGSGQMMNLWQVAAYLSRALIHLFLPDANGRRPIYGGGGGGGKGGSEHFHTDPRWRDLILFNEYFHGDNGTGLGASHQTGWTALVAKLIEQSGG